VSPTEILALIGGILGVTAGLSVAVRKAWRGAKMFEALHSIARRELTPNGGSSLYDKITRTEERSAATAGLLSEHLIVAQQDHESLAYVRRHLGLD
jgi:hypothetical protein